MIYIGETKQTLHERTEEHVCLDKKSNEQSAQSEQLSTCFHYSHIVELPSVNNHDIKCKNLTLTRLEVALLFLRKQIFGTNCYFKKHY